MTAADLTALAERALGHARGEGQVTVTHERSLLARFAASRPTHATGVDDVTIEVTAVRDGHTATAATTSTEDESLRAAAARAAVAAEAAARGGAGSYPGLPAPGTPARPHDGWDEPTARVEPARAGRSLSEAFSRADAAGLGAFGVWTEGAVRTAIASSADVRVADAATDAYLKVLCRDSEGRSGFAARSAVAAGAIDAAAVTREAAGKVSAAEPASLPPGDYPAVLDADAVALLLEFAGDLAFNGLAHAEGRGALSGRLGSRVAAATINLSDSPGFPGTLPRAFDAEGVAKRPLPLIQDGVAASVVHDTRSAALAGGGARSTGHALAPGGAPDGPAPRNLVLVGGGARDVEELARPIARGIYVTRLWYVNAVHRRHALLTGMTRDGTFLIEDGRISRPLTDVRFTDSVLGLLERTEALAARPRLVSQGEFYGRRFASGVVCPAIRVGALRVTGATRPRGARSA